MCIYTRFFYFFSHCFNDVLRAITIHICQTIRKTLLTPLKSNGIPPHFWITCDKATISRLTVQCIILVAVHNIAVFPIGSPAVYKPVLIQSDNDDVDPLDALLTSDRSEAETDSEEEELPVICGGTVEDLVADLKKKPAGEALFA